MSHGTDKEQLQKWTMSVITDIRNVNYETTLEPHVRKKTYRTEKDAVQERRTIHLSHFKAKMDKHATEITNPQPKMRPGRPVGRNEEGGVITKALCVNLSVGDISACKYSLVPLKHSPI